MDIQGKYNTAKVYATLIEDEAVKQIKTMCDMPFAKDAKIAIMPDVHSGKGCTIGTTMTVTDKICPNLVGVDIGCGMYCVKLKEKEIDFEKLDLVVNKVPHGFDTWDDVQLEYDLSKLKCFKRLKDVGRLKRSLGTLGGGNHFIELDKDSLGNIYLVIHSGSRNLGTQVANLYQDLAIHNLRSEIVENDYPRDLCYLEGECMDDYLFDVAICQSWAKASREFMAKYIMKRMNFECQEDFHTIHNYIDVDNMILRKGSISAQKGEKVIIPINMRDGSVIGYGKGNADWNFSAPHGAGRIMSRTQAKAKFTLNEFVKSMEGIYTTSVNENTLDEAPMVYKSLDDIIPILGDSVEIAEIIKPIYNFKSSDTFTWQSLKKKKFSKPREKFRYNGFYED